MSFKKNLFIALALGLFIVTPVLALGDFQSGISKFKGTVGPGSGLAGKETATLDVVIGRGINVALTLVGLIFLILMVYAGYLWMTAQGEEEQVKRAQKIITASIIGIVIVLSAYAITALVLSRFATV